MIELRTARTRLSPFGVADQEGLVRLFRDPGVRRYLLDDTLVSESWVGEEIRTSQLRFSAGSGGLWCVRLAEDSQIIGFVGFREFFDPPQLQLIYGLLPEYWGRGLATEVATQACQYGFDELGFERIIAAVDVPNRASIQVLERLGMTQDRATDDGAEGTFFFRLELDHKRST